MRVLPLACLLACAAAAAPASAAPQFDPPVKLTIEQGFGGYEPGISIDRFNNILVTAHKQNHGLVLSPDRDTPLGARSMSWVWWSKDGGRTFGDPPGMTALMEQTLEFGDEGDLATDDADNTYFVDTNVADVTFSRWHATGLGQLTLETTRPILPAGEPVDDRPWVVAHGDGTVLYLGNEGDKATYPAGQSGAGDANGPGRYTVYRSTDGGDTFDPIGYTLKDSGWCRPARDRIPNDHRFVVICTDDAGADAAEQTVGSYGGDVGKLYSYVSTDDGVTWSRHEITTYHGQDPWQSWPAATIGPDGTISALYLDDEGDDGDGYPTTSHLLLVQSGDGGVTWTRRELAGQKLMRYMWLDVAPDGTIGVAYYGRPDVKHDWHLYAGTIPVGGSLGVTDLGKVASADYPEPFGDFFECQFGPDDKLNVVWTFQNLDLLLEGLNTDIYYARQT